jgi:hypothetical protein
MRKNAWYVVAVGLSVGAVAGWVATSTHARLEAPNEGPIDPIAIMARGDVLEAQPVVDFSFVFE